MVAGQVESSCQLVATFFFFFLVSPYQTIEISLGQRSPPSYQLLPPPLISNDQLLFCPNDQLLVADIYNNCIFRFTLDGTYVDKFGNDHLSLPTALTIDMSGFVLVSDEDHN